jgi:serine phosphatase RsbU (regulator of sigma subunit)
MNHYYRYLITILLAGLLSVNGFAQSRKVDSLKDLFANEKQDSNRMLLAYQISRACNNAALYSQGQEYGKQAIELAEKLQASGSKSLLFLAKKTEGKVCINLGNSYEDVADYPNALFYYNKALKLKEELGDKPGVAHAYNNIGLVYENQADYPTSLEYFFKSLNIATDLKDTADMSLGYNNIGTIYLTELNYKEAIIYFLKTMQLSVSQGDKKGEANAYNNLGQAYQGENNSIEALDNYKKCLALRLEINDLDGVAYAYNNIGSVYYIVINQTDSIKKRLIKLYYSKLVPAPTVSNVDLMLMDSALDLHQKALEISKKIEDKYSIVYALEGIGQIIKQRGEYTSALYYFREGASLAKQINTKTEYLNELNNIYECFEKMNKPDSALFYFKEAMSIKDTIFSSDKQKELGREEAKSEFEKQQAVAEAENRRQMAVADEQRKRSQLIIVTGAVGFIMLAFFAFFINQRLKITRQQKTIIERQKESLDTAFVQLEEAKQLVEEKHKDLTDSIQYAKRIQTALFTTEHYLSQHLNDYFILFKPRDIVSGDFYWALEHKGTFYLACCDCTGHGVPGAFMSLLNITFLHQTVVEKAITQPNQIFDTIRATLIEALNPDGSNDTKDGMDAVLCSINFERHLLSAACANNPLWIIRKGEFIEFKADKIPIGEGEEARPFTLHETNLEKGDCIYMFTDGYADQFGGPNGKKYKQAQLKELLMVIHQKPMTEQKELLDKAFADWRGTLYQVDDVCVMGLRV